MRRRGMVRGQEKRKASVTTPASEGAGVVPPGLNGTPSRGTMAPRPPGSVPTPTNSTTPSLAGARVRSIRHPEMPTAPANGPMRREDLPAGDGTARTKPTTMPTVRPAGPAVTTPGVLLPKPPGTRPDKPLQAPSNPADRPSPRQTRPPITAPTPASPPPGPRGNGSGPRPPTAPNPSGRGPSMAMLPALPSGAGFPAPQPRPLPTAPPASSQSSSVVSSLAKLKAALETPPVDKSASDANAAAGAAQNGSKSLSSNVLASLARIAGPGDAALRNGRPPDDPAGTPKTPPKPAAE